MIFAKQFSSTVNPNIHQLNSITPCPDKLLMSLPVLTIGDAVSAIKGLAPKKSPMEMGILPLSLKGVIFVPVLRYIFNMSLKTGTFPSASRNI